MIAREGEAARWREVADALRARIRSGELAPGVALPSEVALGQQYGVGFRNHVRDALVSVRDRYTELREQVLRLAPSGARMR